MPIHAVGAAREEHCGDHDEGDDREEAHGEVDISGHHHAHHEQCHEVAQQQQGYHYRHRVAVGVEHLADSVLADVLDGDGPEEGRHERQGAHEADEAVPYLGYAEFAEEGVEDGAQDTYRE